MELFFTFATLAALHWVALLSPGANTLLIAQLAASGQARAARAASLGIALVALTWATLAVLGVNAVFDAHPKMRLGLQLAGGAYLLCLASKMWRAASTAFEGHATSERWSAVSALKLGLLTNLGNPKTALFFGSVFATALPAQPSAGLLASAVALMFANSLGWHLLLSFAFSRAQVQRAYANHQRLLNRLAASVLSVFALRLWVQPLRELSSR